MPSTELALAIEGEAATIAALRQGDEHAFSALVDAYSPMLLRVAMSHVPSRAVAEEVVQETWISVLRGIDGFQGRSSLKSWIFKILRNTAITRGERERRTVPVSCLAAADGNGLDLDRFFGAGDPRYPGHWALGPTRWPLPEEGLLDGETREVIADAIKELPEAQRAVISLRDVEGWSAEEVCDALSVSDGNQRVLLHRARTRVRADLERYFGAVEPTLPEPQTL
jgi:RNA polymerase sigma-70 factor (ECF subfamily)